MNKIIFNLIISALLSCGIKANAATITFDNYKPGSSYEIINTLYEDMSWDIDKISVFNKNTYTWLNYAVSSGNYAAMGFSNPVIKAADNSLFTLNSIYLSSIFYNNSPMTVFGYKDNSNTPFYTKNLILSANSREKIEFNWTDIKRVKFDTQIIFMFGMDDFNVTLVSTTQPSPVPEPSCLLLGLIGLSGVLGLKKRNI